MNGMTMHVLMVAERLPPAVGGVERHVAGLARELSRRGHQVTLVAPAHQEELPEQEQLDGVHILRMPFQTTRRRAYVHAWAWWRSQGHLLTRTDLLHFHDVYALLHLSAPLLSLIRRERRYLTYHGYEMRSPVPLRARLYRRLSANLVQASLCVGHYLVKTFGLHPQAVIYGAVDPIAPIPPPPAQPAALFVGRLEADTGLEIYLHALAILRQEHGIDLPLTICGEGNLRVPLQAQAARDQLSTRFLGAVPNPQIHLEGASLVFASGYLAMLEAMAGCRPVFAAYPTPVKRDYFEWIPGAADILTIVQDAPTLARALYALLSGQRDFTSQVQAGFRFASRHTWSNLADGYLHLWGAA